MESAVQKKKVCLDLITIDSWSLVIQRWGKRRHGIKRKRKHWSFIYSKTILFSPLSDRNSCSTETCSASYTNSMRYVTRGPNPQFCSVLKTYLECMRQTDRACKGNLYYHSMSVLIINWMTQYNCSAHGLTPSSRDHRGKPTSGKTRSPILPPTPTALRVCTYK